MVRQKKKYYIIVMLIIFMVSAFDQIGNSIRVLKTMIENEKIFVIFKNESGQELLYDSGVLSLNGQDLESNELLPVNESDIPLSTLFLVDVAKTVLYSETSRIIEAAEIFRNNPVFSSPGRSRYFLQTFGNVVSQVSGPSEDPISLVAGIKYEDNTSDYYFALSEAIDFMQDRIDNGYIEKQQIIVFTDATRFSETSISESQLKDKLRKAGIPVYGMVLYNTNTEIVDRKDTDRLLALADASGGIVQVPKGHSRSTTVMTNEIIRDIIACYVASASVNDGVERDPNNNYSISLTISYQNNRIAEIPYTVSLRLPEIPTETPEPTETPTETPVPSQTPAPNETSEPEVNDEEDETWFEKKTELFGHEVSNKWIAIAAGSIGIIVVVSVIIVIISRQKKRERLEKLQETVQSGDNQKTIMVPMIPSINIALNRIGGTGTEPIQIKLRENEEVIFGRMPGNGVIGLENDDTISMIHFKLVHMNGFIFIEDMASSNGVILNGNKLTQRARIKDGDHLLLGRITYRVQVTSPNISIFRGENR